MSKTKEIAKKLKHNHVLILFIMSVIIDYIIEKKRIVIPDAHPIRVVGMRGTK